MAVRIGVALGAGGVAGGAFHAGVLAALADVGGWDPRSAAIIVGTSAGSIAALDLMLRLIADQHGAAFSKAVGEQFVHGGARGADEHQRSDLVHRLGTAKPILIEAVRRMEESLNRPLSPAVIARHLGISQRQLERQFRAQFGRTPVAYHRDLRLDQARRMLTQSTLSVTIVAITCGFGSPSHFAQLYRERFGKLPTQDRK